VPICRNFKPSSGLEPETLLTIEQRGGKRGKTRVASTKEIPEVAAIG
jgi:hypothetical protein